MGMYSVIYRTKYEIHV